MAVLLVTLSLLGIIVGLLYLYLTWNFNYWKKRGVKCPKPKLLYGTLPSMITQKRHMIYDYINHYNHYKKTENFIGNISIRSPELMVLKPSLAKDILISQFRKFPDNYFSHLFDSKDEPIFSLNPFILKGQEWKDKRAEITPALTVNRIKASYPVMQKVCSKMVDFIKNTIKVKGKDHVFDCKELTQRYTIQNVSDCIYGIDAEAFDLDMNNKSELLKQATNLMKGLTDGAMYFFMLTAVPFLAKLWKPRSLSLETENFFHKLIKDAIELRKTTNQTDRIDFLNYLMILKEKKGLKDVELLSHSITFLLDGFDTSAMVLAHAILCLGRDIEIQSKLRQEIEKNSDEDGTINFEKLQEMPYLEQCLNETLRIFPPASIMQKISVEETELTNLNGKNLLVKKEMPVAIPIYCFHNDEEFFPNPNKFDPERFSLENGGEKRYKEMGVFLPFGDGPRTCLGRKFALTQVKIALCELVRNFEFSVNDKTRKDHLFEAKSFILYLDGGIWCSFNELKN